MRNHETLPPPEGHFIGDGFTLQRNEFLAGPKLAEIVPHKGLIVAVMGSAMQGFPIEEYAHMGTVTRNPDLVQTSLIDYWQGRTGSDIRPIAAWAPLVEAVNQVYLEAHQRATPRDDSGQSAQSLNAAYGDWYAQQVWDWQHQRTSDSEREPSSGPTGHSDTIWREWVKPFTKKINRFISAYKAEGLHHQDIHEDFLREGDVVILLLLEIFLPYTAASTALEHTDTWIHTTPSRCWAATEATLDAWTLLVNHGDSPFPIEQATPPDLFQTFEILWAGHITTTLTLLSTALLSRDHEPYLVKTLLALYWALNPHTAVQWFASPHNVYRYPTLIMLQDRPECTIVDATRDKRGLSVLAQEIWHQFKQCPLYPDLDAWNLTTKNLDTYKREHFTAMALQIWQFLGRVETLWQDYRDEPTAVACPHCQAILKQLTVNHYLANALELRLFTKLGLQPLLNAARQYLPWIEQEVTQTYRQNPFLTHQEDAVYRQHPFRGLP